MGYIMDYTERFGPCAQKSICRRSGEYPRDRFKTFRFMRGLNLNSIARRVVEHLNDRYDAVGVIWAFVRACRGTETTNVYHVISEPDMSELSFDYSPTVKHCGHTRIHLTAGSQTVMLFVAVGPNAVSGVLRASGTYVDTDVDFVRANYVTEGDSQDRSDVVFLNVASDSNCMFLDFSIRDNERFINLWWEIDYPRPL